VKRALWITLAAFVALILIPSLRAQETDADGCKDSPLIGRFPGSTIHSCENKEFDQADFPLSADSEKTKHLEGEVHSLDYGTREGMSELQLYRNMETALRNAAFVIDYAGSPTDLVAHKGSAWVHIESKGTFYYQTIVMVKEMQQEISADASSLGAEIEKTGHVAVYGIHFDTGKATITTDSGQILGEIVKLLQQNPDLKLRVEGHTDNQGNAAANQALSEKRAQSVVAWLTGHGVVGARLTAVGLGQTKPLADNQTEDGRAKNRRVELAKQ
jgi:OOP family OmpA-OmpF porin